MTGARGPGRAAALRYRAGALSVAAGLAHAAVAPEHLREWWGYGLFFGVAAAAQVLYGALLIVAPWRYDETGGLRADGRPRAEAAMYGAGIVVNAGLILLYAVTRTTGLPLLGPEAGAVEPVSLGGLVTKLCEVALVATLVSLRRPAVGQVAPAGPG